MGLGVFALRIEPDRRLVQPIGNGAVVGPSSILVDENRFRVEVVQFVPNPDKKRRTAERPQAGVDLAVEKIKQDALQVPVWHSSRRATTRRA